MKNFKVKTILVSFCIFLFIITSGCSSNSDNQTEGSTDSSAALTDDQKIEAVLNEAMDRIRLKDKSYIYEMEFDYYKDEITFDEYLADRRIATVSADTIYHVKVLSVEYFDDDSASAVLEFHFKGPSGVETTKKTEGNKFYKRNGKWIRPTLSLIERQIQYEEIQRQARESAESESGKYYF